MISEEGGARLADFTLIPAGLATLSGRRVLFAGAPGSGKTALVLELLSRGAAVHSDQFVLLARARVIPLSLRLGAREAALPAELRRDTCHQFIDPADLEQPRDLDLSRISAIVWLEAEDKGGGGVRPLPRIEMVRNLLSIVVDPLRDPGRKIAELNSLVAASDSLLIRSGSPRETAAAVLEFFSADRRGPQSLPPAQSGDSRSAIEDPQEPWAPITIITGSGRCGTSFTAQAFLAAGFDPGGAFGEDVRAGWEHAPVVAVNQELDRRTRFPEQGESRRIAAEFRDRLAAALTGKRIVKDPRFTGLLGVWAAAGLIGRVIHLVRPASEVISSADAAFPDSLHRRTRDEIEMRTRYLSAVCERCAIPRVVLRFPEVAREEGPDFLGLAAEIERLGASRERAVESIRRTRNPDLVRHSPPRRLTPDAGRPARHFLSLCAIAKDETPFLREWVEFHRIVGVEHFFIFDNDSRTPIAETLADEVARGDVTVRKIAGTGRQLTAYNDCLREFGGTSQWIGFLDLDEFLMPRETTDLRPLLEEYAGFGGLGVNWVMFGPSGHRTRPTGLQIENYTLRMPDDWGGNKHVKCVVQPGAVLRFDNPHSAIYREGDCCVGEHFDRVEGPFRPPSTDRIRINHYFTRSEQDFREKIGRGSPNEGGSAKKFDRFELFRTKATVRDLTALPYVAALKKKIR